MATRLPTLHVQRAHKSNSVSVRGGVRTRRRPPSPASRNGRAYAPATSRAAPPTAAARQQVHPPRPARLPLSLWHVKLPSVRPPLTRAVLRIFFVTRPGTPPYYSTPLTRCPSAHYATMSAMLATPSLMTTSTTAKLVLLICRINERILLLLYICVCVSMCVSVCVHLYR